MRKLRLKECAWRCMGTYAQSDSWSATIGATCSNISTRASRNRRPPECSSVNTSLRSGSRSLLYRRHVGLLLKVMFGCMISPHLYSHSYNIVQSFCSFLFFQLLYVQYYYDLISAHLFVLWIRMKILSFAACSSWCVFVFVCRVYSAFLFTVNEHVCNKSELCLAGEFVCAVTGCFGLVQQQQQQQEDGDADCGDARRWRLACDVACNSTISDQTRFSLRRGDIVTMLVTVRRLPSYHLQPA